MHDDAQTPPDGSTKPPVQAEDPNTVNEPGQSPALRVVRDADEHRPGLFERAQQVADAGGHLIAFRRGRKPAFAVGYTDRPIGDITRESLNFVSDRLDSDPRGGSILGVEVVLGPRSIGFGGVDDRILLAIETEGAGMKDRDFLRDWQAAMDQLEPADLPQRAG